jgi:hypothetical protein
VYIVSSTIDYFDPATKFSALFAVNSQEAHFSPLLKEHRCQAKEEAQQKSNITTIDMKPIIGNKDI